jgi:hypothetical protein
MSRPRSAVLAAVLTLTVLAGTPTPGATAAALAAAPLAATPLAATPPPSPTAATEPPLPDAPVLDEVSPIDEGRAVAPGDAALPPLEKGAARLGASAVPAPPLTFTFKATAYAMKEPERNHYPYARLTPIALIDTDTHDKYGVRMRKIGTRLYDHPVAQAGYGINNVESYLVTEDVRFLDRAKAQADRLMKNARKVGNAWYLPYTFDFDLHNKPADRMKTPWYSAMAQGQAMSLFVRLWEVTADEKYRNAADGVFNSFLRPRNATTPWIVWVDAAKHLWLEEYAGPKPDRTFNGQIFATFGLWDYWRLTKDERAAKLYQGGLTTVMDNYGSKWRNKNYVSHYCVTHPTALDEKYHLIHIGQMFHMYAISEDVRFLRVGETFMRDFPKPEVKGTVHFAIGSYTAVTFTSKGKVSKRKSVTFTKATFAPTNRRARIVGQPGYWHRITSGTLKGWYTKETVGRTYLRGRVMAYTYRPARPASIAAGKPVRGYTFDNAGKVLTSMTVTPAEVTTFGITSIAIWNGREHVLAADGPLTGKWIPSPSMTL